MQGFAWASPGIICNASKKTALQVGRLPTCKPANLQGFASFATALKNCSAGCQAAAGPDPNHLQCFWNLCSAGWALPESFATLLETLLCKFCRTLPGPRIICNACKKMPCRLPTCRALLGLTRGHLQRFCKLCSAGCQPAGLCLGIARIVWNASEKTALQVANLQGHWKLCFPVSFATLLQTLFCRLPTCRAFPGHCPHRLQHL